MWFSFGTENVNSMCLFNQYGSVVPLWQIITSSSTVASLTDGTVTYGAKANFAVEYNSSDFVWASSGVLSSSTSTGSVPSVSTFYLGASTIGYQLNGSIPRFTYYPVRLSNQQLQTLSSPSQYSPRISTPTVTLRAAYQSVYQSDTQAFFVATLSQPALSTITVPYTISGTAVSGTDYSGLASGNFTFAAGQSIAILNPTVLTTASNGKTLILTLGTPTGATLGTYSSETTYLTGTASGFTLTASTITNNGSIAIYFGTCAPGMTVTVTGNQSTSFVCPSTGAFSFTTAAVSSDGSYTYTFTEGDGINSGTAVTGTYDRDTTAPTAVATLTDGNYTTSLTTAPTFTWTASTDSGTGASGISYYQIGITTASGTPPTSWTSVGNVLTYQLTGLSLTDGVMYYGAVEAFDAAGNVSSITYGDGFSVVTDTPSLALNFMNSSTIGAGTATTSTNASYPAMIQFSNASGSSIAAPMYYNSAGVLTAAAENLLKQSQNFGTTWTTTDVSVATAAGVAPDGTSTSNLITGDGTYNGHSILQSLSYAVGNTLTMSVYFKAGSSSYAFLRLRNSAATNQIVAFFNLTNGTLQSSSYAGTGSLTNATITSVGNGWYRAVLTGVTSTTAGDTSIFAAMGISDANSDLSLTSSGTLYAWGAQVELATSASSYIYTTTTAAYGPRFDYNPATLALNGLLIESSNTNSIRNNTMQGVATGTPGTMPSHWAISNNVGLTSSIVGTGTDSGISYIDLQLSGTTTATNNFQVLFESSTQIAGTQNQLRAVSAFIKLQAGTTTGLTATTIYLAEETSGGSYLTEGGTAFTLTSAALNQDRYYYGRTLTNASTTYVTPFLQLNFSSGATVNMTLRIGMPQVESGTVSSSVIPTTTVGMTRSADNALLPSLSTLSWFNAANGTLAASGISPSSTTNSNRLISLDDTTITNEMICYLSPYLAQTVKAAGTVNLSTASSAFPFTANAVYQVAIGYGSNNFAGAANGSIATSSSGVVPTVTQLSIGETAGGSFLNGWIQSINYYNTRLSNSAIQELTNP